MINMFSRKAIHLSVMMTIPLLLGCKVSMSQTTTNNFSARLVHLEIPITSSTHVAVAFVTNLSKFGSKGTLTKINSVGFLIQDNIYQPHLNKTDSNCYIIYPYYTNDNSPDIAPLDENLLFLTKENTNAFFRKEYELKENDEVYRVCNGRNASISLNFTDQSGSLKFLKQYAKNFKRDELINPVNKELIDLYNIGSKDVLIDRMSEILKYRSFTKIEDQISYLMHLLNKKESFYIEVSIPILKSLGCKVELIEGTYKLLPSETGEVAHVVKN